MVTVLGVKNSSKKSELSSEDERIVFGTITTVQSAIDKEVQTISF